MTDRKRATWGTGYRAGSKPIGEIKPPPAPVTKPATQSQRPRADQGENEATQ